MPSRSQAFSYAALTLTFSLFLFWIRPQYGGDPAGYARHAYLFLTHPGLEATRGLLEFGHLLWRPAAVGVTVLCGTVISAWTHAGPPLVPLAALIALNAILSWLAFLLIYKIGRRLSGPLAGWIVALLFLTSNAVLTYLRSGYSYLPGLAMQIVAVSIVLATPASARLGLRAVSSLGLRAVSSLGLRAFWLGCALAASFCLWVPYVVTVPGVIVLALLWEKGGLARTERRRLAMLAALWLAAISALLFGGAILLNRFQSPHQIADWIRDSSHEWAQTRRLARLVTGLPRSLLALQDETVMLKRLYLHDPYAPVTWKAILAAVAWKPPLFALAMGALGWLLAKTEEGRRLLIANLCAWIPLIVFAVTVFEPGSPSRFLPGFALLFTGLAYAAGRLSWRQAPARIVSVILSVFFAAMLVLNVSSVSPAARQARDRNALARLEAYNRVRKPNDVLFLLGFKDSIFRFQNADPFHPFSQADFRVLDAMEPGTLRGLHFRQVFADEAGKAWQHGGDVWISRRLVAERPLPEWDWVEGDTPGVGWKDLSAYYRQFATDAETGGADGFLRIAASPENRVRVSADLPQ
jgi:hypothetical protein